MDLQVLVFQALLEKTADLVGREGLVISDRLDPLVDQEEVKMEKEDQKARMDLPELLDVLEIPGLQVLVIQATRDLQDLLAGLLDLQGIPELPEI
jgi:hypothetical protein